MLYTAFMKKKPFCVLDLLNLELKTHNGLYLKCISGKKGLSSSITVPEINRPGLALSGFFDTFAHQRIQVFGRGECAYLQQADKDKLTQNLETFFSYDIPCCIFTNNQTPDDNFLHLAQRKNCPILQTTLETAEFINRVTRVCFNIFAPKKTMHGVLMEVYGVGILLIGSSGVGKSEAALELIERGHRLVADDMIEIRCINGAMIVGQGINSLMSHHMEIRGLGIINVSDLYGMGAIKNQQEIQLVIKLTEWDNEKVYNRIGTDDKIEFLGLQLPYAEIPIKPGRNLPIIIEAAAKNERLKEMGHYSAREFNRNILKWIEIGEAQSSYYNEYDAY